MTALFDVTMYTDGASRPNPGPSGYAAVLLYMLPDGKEHRHEGSGGYRRSTASLSSQQEVGGPNPISCSTAVV